MSESKFNHNSASDRNSLLSYTAVLLLACLLSACGSLNNFNLANSFAFGSLESNLEESSGSMMIAKSIPEQRAPETKMLGFFPSDQSSNRKLVIDRNSRQVRLLDSNSVVVESWNIKGAENLKPGTFEVMLKQRNALWYAPASYFLERDLPVPAEGASQRYRRGALGDYVIYIDENTPLHSGPVWLSQIGGLQIDPQELGKIYFGVEVGTPVVVR